MVNNNLVKTAIFITIVFFSGSQRFANAADRSPTDVLKADECLSCHRDAQHKTVGALTLQCSSCHTLSRITATDQTEGLAPHKVAQKNRHSKYDPGMSLPMYYTASRLGDKPNEMVRVPGGPFTMGTDSRLPDEGPQHIVSISPFYIDKYEVTNLQYRAFISATKRRSPRHFENRTFPQGKADHPVTQVTWYDAEAYCKWANKRLPSDAEWEKAARGTDGRRFPWGNQFELHSANTPQRWAILQHEGDTSPVGAFHDGISPYGAYDMSGNVWEWTNSWYLAYPGNQKVSENYGETYKTLKGGSWWDCSFYKCGVSAPVFNRSFFLRSSKNKSFGFRCAKSAKKETGTFALQHH
ncbi:MAG: formylglycine-generating enzyme family protein [Gammaproteobacteria bacterium]|nr:formylglycine-generating enzyme family protein [Gammaproteobacteria bacterium]